MVEIREENDEHSTTAENNRTQGGGDSNNPRKSPIDFVKENPSEVLSFGLRLATFYFVIFYVLPVATPQFQKLAYTKAFAAAAATNAFRLHQRLRTVNVPIFSQHFLVELMMEDSAHYLFYCLILVMSSPITLALLPITLNALFNVVNFLNKFSTEVGYISSSITATLVRLKQQHAANMLSTVACAEIFLFPILIIMIFLGKASLFTPFIYYRFLTMRYLSRRNPYTREMFTQLKFLIFSMANHQRCPTAFRSLIFKFVSFIDRLAPQVPM